MRDVICCADWAQLLYLVLTSPALQSCAWTTALLALPLWDDFVWSKQGRFGCMQRPQPSSFPGTRRHAAERTCKHQQAVLWTGLRAENNLTIYVCYGSAVSRGDDFSSALFDRLCIKSWVYLRRDVGMERHPGLQEMQAEWWRKNQSTLQKSVIQRAAAKEMGIQMRILSAFCL